MRDLMDENLSTDIRRELSWPTNNQKFKHETTALKVPYMNLLCRS